jgi:hypothetical protein
MPRGVLLRKGVQTCIYKPLNFLTNLIIFSTMTHICNILSIIVLLVFGVSSYQIFRVANLLSSQPANILMAAGCRLLSLLAYRFFLPVVREIPVWVAFEWLIPLVILGELSIAACGLAPVLGDGEFTTVILLAIIILIYLILSILCLVRVRDDKLSSLFTTIHYILFRYIHILFPLTTPLSRFPRPIWGYPFGGVPDFPLTDTVTITYTITVVTITLVAILDRSFRLGLKSGFTSK